MKLLFLYLFVFSLRNTNTKKISKNIKLLNYKQSLSLYIKETNYYKKYITLTCLKNDDISEKDKNYNNLSIKNHEITNNKSSNIFVITILLFYFIGLAYNNSKK